MPADNKSVMTFSLYSLFSVSAIASLAPANRSSTQSHTVFVSIVPATVMNNINQAFYLVAYNN